MSDNTWSPALIGYAVSGLMYGTTLGQSICYKHWFPHDHWFNQALVLVVILADTAHFIGSTRFIWVLLVSCHGKYSWRCKHEMNWGGYAYIFFSYHMIFAIECFYCRRIWTISENNKVLTFVIFVTAVLGYAFSTWFFIKLAQIGTLDYLRGSPLILPYSVTTTICDLVIAGAVIKYMWKSGIRRQQGVIQHLARICISTGAFTCMMAIIFGILVLVQGNGYWVPAAGIILGRSYVNSMLAVLNARRIIRDRDVNVVEMTSIAVTRESARPPRAE